MTLQIASSWEVLAQKSWLRLACLAYNLTRADLIEAPTRLTSSGRQ
ncbi:hypothetical protein [Nocardia australiensis]|nr:hypothetical protein [Nocardia australiensis]